MVRRRVSDSRVVCSLLQARKFSQPEIQFFDGAVAIAQARVELVFFVGPGCSHRNAALSCYARLLRLRTCRDFVSRRSASPLY